MRRLAAAIPVANLLAVLPACGEVGPTKDPQGRVKVPEGEDRKAALPPDVRKGFEAVKKLILRILALCVFNSLHCG